MVTKDNVRMVLDENDAWRVVPPDGAPLDVEASKTQGLQKAINYAAEHGFGLKVVGGIFDHPPAIARNVIGV